MQRMCERWSILLGLLPAILLARWPEQLNQLRKSCGDSVALTNSSAEAFASADELATGSLIFAAMYLAVFLFVILLGLAQRCCPATPVAETGSKSTEQRYDAL